MFNPQILHFFNGGGAQGGFKNLPLRNYLKLKSKIVNGSLDLFRQGSDEKNLINEDPERPEDRDQVNHHPEPDRPPASLPGIQVSHISDKYDGIGTNPTEAGGRRDSQRLASDLMNEYSMFSEILPPPTHPEISRWKIKSNGFKTETN